MRPLTKTNLRPMGDHVLLEPDDFDELSDGGLWIPESAQDAYATRIWRATVLAVGPGRRDEDGRRQPLDVKVGDRVRFCRNSIGASGSIPELKCCFVREEALEVALEDE